MTRGLHFGRYYCASIASNRSVGKVESDAQVVKNTVYLKQRDETNQLFHAARLPRQT